MKCYLLSSEEMNSFIVYWLNIQFLKLEPIYMESHPDFSLVLKCYELVPSHLIRFHPE